MIIYPINKGINKPIEFKGLKAQYIGYLAAGLVFLLIGFAVIYISGMPVAACVTLVFILASALFYQVYTLSHKYGQHGLMKKFARGNLPSYIRFSTRNLFLRLKR